jgi:hypothetical protein
VSWPYWFELAVVFGLTAFGTIFFGHFEEHTPKWRKVLKLFLIAGISVLISATAGRGWFFALLGTMLLAVVVIHAWWLPVKKGINGWTAEPRDRYYEFRGWKVKPPGPPS